MEREVKRSGWRMGARAAAVAACPLFVISTALAQAVPQDDVAAPPVSPPPPPLAGSGSIKSADEITCELAGDCASSEAGNDEPDERSFSLRLPKGGATKEHCTSNCLVISPGRLTGASRPRNIPARRLFRNGEGAGIVTLAIPFESGSADLSSAGREQARLLLQALVSPKLAGRRIQVNGHTDAMGDLAANIQLSQRRAEAVVDFLVTNGIDRALLAAKGFGAQKLLPGVNPKSSANRRVEIELIK